MFARRRKSQPRGVVAVLMCRVAVRSGRILGVVDRLGNARHDPLQLQDVSDAAAMAGCRSLNGNTTNNANNNYSAVAPTATAVAMANTVMGGKVQSTNVSVNIGRWTYNTPTQTFQGQFPGPSGTNWSLVQATVTSNIASQLAFSRLFNYTRRQREVTSTAIHRPRDIAVVLDFSGSMRFSSLLGVDYATSTRASNNPDGLIPVWGHYSDVSDGGPPGNDASRCPITRRTSRPPPRTAVRRSFRISTSTPAARRPLLPPPRPTPPSPAATRS